MYRDKERQKQKQHESYLRNKEKVKQRFRDRRKSIKTWFRTEVLSKVSCSQCGESHPGCMDFHHINPSEKGANISHLIHGVYNTKLILAEIDKCVVLCANCHRKLHWEEQK